MIKLRMVALPIAVAAAVAGGLMLLPQMHVAEAGPTCSGTLGIETHGQHVVGDYVSGVGHEALGWPPSGQDVGDAIGGDGASVPGGPGPGFHFPNGFAPGASFCLEQSQSPGFHPGP